MDDDVGYGYVVSEIDYQYNDEIHYTSEHGYSGDPIGFFFNRESAERARDREEVDAFRLRFSGQYANTLGNYAYDLHDITPLDEGDFTERLEAIFGCSDCDPLEFSLPENVTDQQIQDLIEIVTIRFFTITKVPIMRVSETS